MNDEQKYKKALEKIREGLQPLSDGAKIYGVTRAFLEEVFPELKENEDKRMWELIKKYAHYNISDITLDADHITREQLESWLEKQGQEPKKVSIWKHWKNGIAGNGDGKPIFLIKTGYTYSLSSCLSFECDYIELSELDNLLIEKQVEKKAIDKVEPKFREGDWIVYNNDVCQIVKREEGCNKLVTKFGIEKELVNERNLSTARLWTIQDAKDGDVLACGDKVTDCPFIFHNLTEKQNPRSYCGIDTLGEFQVNDENGGFWCYSNEVRPATKEQRDLLFSEMKEAGYEWNPDKKELKKIEDEIEIPFGAKDSELQEVTYYIPKGFHAEIDDDKVVIKKGEKPAEWSEEDERIRKALVRFHKSTIDVDGIKGEEIVAWLEKQSGCFAIWKKNTTDNKPTLNHSVLMKSIHGIAEGEWNGKEWIQYKWSCKVKDSDVLYWMDLHELEKQGEQKSPWSEDDERIVTALMEGFRYHQLFNPKFGEVPNAEIISWIKSLKERLS